MMKYLLFVMLLIMASTVAAQQVSGPEWVSELSHSDPPHNQRVSITLPVNEITTVLVSYTSNITVDAPPCVEYTVLAVTSETRRVFTGMPEERIATIPYWLPPAKRRQSEGSTEWAVQLRPMEVGSHEIKIACHYRDMYVDLDVRPAVPDPDMGFGFYFGLCWIHYPQNIDLYLSDMVKHRLNTSAAFVNVRTTVEGNMPEGYKDADVGWGTTEAEFGAWLIEKYVDHGLNRFPIITGHMTTSEVIDEMKTYAKRLAQWPEIIGYNRDEPSVEWKGDIIHYGSAWRAAGYRHGTSLGSAAAFAFADELDVCILAVNGVSRYAKSHIEKSGADFWAYNSEMRGTNAPLNRYYTGLWCWVIRPKVALKWNYTHFDWSHVGPDGWKSSAYHDHVLPSPDGPISSVGYEGVRDGIIDYMILRELERQVEANPTHPLIPEIVCWLQRLQEKVEWDMWPGEYDRTYGPWPWDRPDLAKPPISDMNEVRKRACDYIANLQKS